MTYAELIEMSADYYGTLDLQPKLDEEAFINLLRTESQDIESLVQRIDVTISRYRYRSNDSVPTDKNELNRLAALTAVALVIAFEGMPPNMISHDIHPVLYERLKDYIKVSNGEDRGAIVHYDNNKTAKLKNLKRAAEMLATYWHGSPSKVEKVLDNFCTFPHESIDVAADYHKACAAWNAEIRRLFIKFAHDIGRPLNEADLSLDNNTLIMKLKIILTESITYHARRYANHVEHPELNMDEDTINRLKFLATAAITIARSGFKDRLSHGYPTAEIELACAMLSVYSGGENFNSDELPEAYVLGRNGETIEIVVNRATKLLDKRRSRIQDRVNKKPSVR